MKRGMPMPRRPLASSGSVLLALVVAGGGFACPASSAPAPAVAKPPAARAPADAGTSRPSPPPLEPFDALVTPELVFPVAAQRAHYRPHPPLTEDGRRSYSFELLPQPGMVPSRHYHLITFTVARAGTFIRQPSPEPTVSGTGGPNGGLVDASVQTADGAYDLSVSEAMLLPDSVQPPEFRVTAALRELRQRYERGETAR
jgi:hypothetical protein